MTTRASMVRRLAALGAAARSRRLRWPRRMAVAVLGGWAALAAVLAWTVGDRRDIT